MEMFERDVQPSLDNYLAGRSTEADFLAKSRPWPRYSSDYRPLVELAHASNWPVIASDVPRRLASLVSRRGLENKFSTRSAPLITPSPRANSAARTTTTSARFAQTMSEMPSHSGDSTKESAAEKAATIERIYQAQCIKDETMGESVALAYAAGAATRARGSRSTVRSA